jgi:hypothetical protein
MRIASSIGWVTDSYDERPDWGATLMGIGVVSPPSTLNGRWIGEKWRQSGVTISGMVKARKGYIKHAGHWVQHPLSYNTIQRRLRMKTELISFSEHKRTQRGGEAERTRRNE